MLGSAITADQFTDDDGHFSEPYNDRMAELGITNGCATNPDRYCPHNPVLREQMAVFIVRAELLTLNAAPVVDNSGGSASFTEGAVPVAIDSAVTVADADGGNLASGRVQLTGGCQPGEDVLALVAPPPGITVSAYVPATCTLDLTGPASIAAFQTALRGVTYTNSSDNPSTLSRTATFSVNDGAASGSDTRTITVTAVNDAPLIGLSGSAPSYTEDGPAVTVDGGLTVADPDNTNLASGSVTVSAGGQAGDALTFTPGATGIIDTNAAADVLTLTGTTTVANWQTVLRSVQFSTTNQNPTTSRTIRFVVNDGLAASTNADKTVAVVPVSEPPVLTQPDAGTLSYTEGDAATPVAPNITAADVDSATFVGATIDVGTGYVNGQDVLSLGTNPQNGISAAFDATTGTLTLSGTANPAQYQTALRDVRFANTSDDPTGGVRNITFQVTDGDAGSNTVSRNVNVVPVNDAPTADDETFSGASGAIGNTTLVVNDPDDGAPSTPDPTDTGPVTNRPHKTISGDILTGDTDPDGPALTVTPGVFPTSDGGTVTLEGDGDFTFEPAPATSCADASDFFDYTVSDGAVPTPGTDTGRVTISVSGCVWYVNNDDGQGNSGTAEKPFDTLAQAETASSAGHTIFIYDGNNTTTGYAAGINLKANQKLVGEAAPLTIGSDTLHSADAANRPTITDTNADVVDLDDGNEVRGVSIDPAGAGGGIAGSSGDTGGGTIDDVSITDVTPFGTQPGLELDSTTGTYAISNITVSTTDATGVRLNASGTVTFAAAGLVTITTAGAKGLDVTNTNLGTSTVDTISVTGSTSGALSLTTTSGTTTFGLLALTTTGGTTPAFQLANAGTVTVTNGASTLASTTAAALDVANTTIGAAGLTFRSISSNGAVNGIVLNSTGSSGGLTVTGDGSAGTGGTIQSSTGPGILLTSTSAPSFSFMAIQNGADDGIRGSGVTGFTLASSSVTNNGNATGESGLEFSGLVGTASISSSTIAGSPENGMVVTNSSGSLSLVVNESTLNSTSTLTSGNDGLQLAANDTASMTVTVAGSTFSDNRGDHFQFGTNATSVGSNSVTFSNNTLIGDRGSAYGGTDLNAGIVISPDGSADTSYTISQNNVQGAVSHAIAVVPGTSSTAGSLTSGTISTNTIGTALTADSGSAQGSGIAAYAQGDGIHTVRIENNQVRQWTGTAGIDVQIREGSASLNATITGNTVANPGTLGGSGLHGTAGGLATDDGTMCASITGNTMAGSAGAGGVSDFRVRQRFFTTVRLPGYAGLAGDTAAVVAFVQGNNPGAETGSATANFPLGGGGFVGGAACATP